MILPSKHVPSNKALLTVGADILSLLDTPKTVSAVWDRLRAKWDASDQLRFGYDWFVLALVLLHSMKAIDYRKGAGTLERCQK